MNKITQPGQPCRHCGTPVVRKAHATPPARAKGMYLAWWMFCPKCHATFSSPTEYRNCDGTPVAVFEKVRKERRNLVRVSGAEYVPLQHGPAPGEDVGVPW